MCFCFVFLDFIIVHENRLVKQKNKKIYKKSKISKTDAGAVMSYYGWIKHSNSYKLNEKYVKPYVNMAECKEVLKNENRKYNKARRV